MKFRIFISSVQSEFVDERRRLAEYIRQDALLGIFFDPFLFEECAACDRTPQDVYLKEVENCDIYLGILGSQFGFRLPSGASATESEYDLATQLGKTRLVFLKDVARREADEQRFVDKVQAAVTRKSFADFEGLQLAVYGALIRHLGQCGYVRMTPFDAAFDTGLTIADIDQSKVDEYFAKAREAKKITIPDDADAHWILEKLEALAPDGRISNAAVLLFAKDPQRKFISSEVKCLQYWGTEVERPIPSYRILNGGLVRMIEDALAFVMSRINHEVGEPNRDGAAPGRDELPYLAVREAIVNAVCHRDYTDNGSVQVMLFRNRLEIINPGSLPKGWTVEKLLRTHDSKSRNLVLAKALNWAGYVEKSGNGTESIIRRCTAIGLPTPEYQPDNVDFKTIIWRNCQGTVAGRSQGAVRVQSGGVAVAPVVAPEMAPVVAPEHRLPQNTQGRILQTVQKGEMSRQQLADSLGVVRKARSLKMAIDELLSDGLLELSHPENPNDRRQTYRLTSKGIELLKGWENKDVLVEDTIGKQQNA